MKSKSIWLSPTAEPSGYSKLWGGPYLSADADYPTWRGQDEEEYPYVHICQIDCREIAEFDPEHLLPHSGLLNFYAQIEYFLGDLDADMPGSGLWDSELCRVTWSNYSEEDELEEVEVTDEDDNPIFPTSLPLRLSVNEEFAPLERHKLLGEADFMPWECWDSPCEDWVLLLQIDSMEREDFTLQFMDEGTLCFIISKEDLSLRNFDNVRCVLISS